MNSASEVIQPKAPSATNSLCNKTYVYSDLNSELNLSGGSLTGDLSIDGNVLMASGKEIPTDRSPYSGKMLCNKYYVDNALSSKLSLTGGTLSGNITMTDC